jgi:hypothetical protein
MYPYSEHIRLKIDVGTTVQPKFCLYSGYQPCDDVVKGLCFLLPGLFAIDDSSSACAEKEKKRKERFVL